MSSSNSIEALRRAAKLFCNKPVYESNGDATYLIAHSVHCEMAANELETQKAEIERLQELLRARQSFYALSKAGG